MPRRERDKRSAHDTGEDVNLGGGDTLEPIMDPEAATAADDLFAIETGEDIAALLDRLGGNGDGPLVAPEDDDAETIQWAGRETTAEDHVGAGDTPPAVGGTFIDEDALLDDDVDDPSALADAAPSQDAEDPNEFYRSRKPSKLRLGDLLKEMGVVTDEQVDAAMAKQAETRQRLGRILVENGTVSELDMTKALAQKFGVAFIDLKDTSPQSSVAELISEKTLRRYVAVPVRYLDDTTLLLAMADPQNFFVQQDLELITGCQIQPAMAMPDDILEAIAKLNQRRAEIGENTDDLAHEAMDDESLTDIRDATEEAPIVKLVNSVIAQAVDDAASDIHFEPQAKELVARFRIDGVLHEIMSIPRRMQNGVISRLKIMADLDIAERRVPQDGRIGLIVGGKPIDMRVATLPTVYGEKIVMRLLDKSNVMLRLEDLGFSPKALKRFHRSFTKPYGAILVTGPTGSGKSTTLYAALNILNSPEKNIITVEDPVEYRLTGINQVQV
ncbi:MAG TPA: ATPase, T2SS/T4P/T4SS family, partial [Thermoleophilia bacterium]|nr:ATPase, T2SS/T4P/T4SS family [Thermoleophilia bacterium]